MSQQKPTCPHCGSDDICIDAAARWDVDNQKWVLTHEFLEQNNCDGCEEPDIEFVWVDVELPVRKPSTIGVKRYLVFIRKMKEVGWSKAEMPALTDLYWKYHDDDGNLLSSKHA
jgi:hypothetical protein